MAVRSLALTHFTPESIHDAQKILLKRLPTISFKRGDTETFLIVSGIVYDNGNQEARFTLKKTGEEETNLKGQCNCPHFKHDGSCEHVTSLFLYYFLHHNLLEQGVVKESKDLPGDLQGCFPEEFGTIINTPTKLTTQAMANAYSTLNYRLTSKEIIQFPIPKQFSEKLGINFIYEELEKNLSHSSGIKFFIQEKAGLVRHHISIFENLYIFDWDSGEAFHIPNELKQLIQSLRFHSTSKSLEEIQSFIALYQIDSLVELTINGHKIKDWNPISVFNKVVISKNEEERCFNIDLQFYTGIDQEVPAHPVLKTMSIKDGSLTHLKKKKYAYDERFRILELVKTTIVEEGQNQSQIFQESSNLYLNLLKTEYTFHMTHHGPISYHNFSTIKIINQLSEIYGEYFIKKSDYSSQNKSWRILVPNYILFEKINHLQSILESQKIPLVFQGLEVKNWKGNILFERNKSKLDWFELTVDISAEDLKMIKAMEHGGAYYLNGNELTVFDQKQKDLIGLLQRYIKHEKKDQDESIEGQENKKRFYFSLKRARIFELFELKRMGMGNILTQEEEAICQNLLELKSLPEYPLSDSMSEVMRTYQKTGFQWLTFLYKHKFGACLADDMGLGKTIQTISFLESIIDEVKNVLIVCPVTILLNWEHEFTKFGKTKPYIYHGGNRKFPENEKIILTSYGVLKKEYKTTLASRNWDILIMDEVQHLKNIRSIGTFAARSLEAKFRVCLTGTPVENDLSEFYNILDLCIPGVWGDLHFFKTRGSQKSRVIAKRTAAPFILRRTKSQVLNDLPPKIENTVFLEFSDEELDQYKKTLIEIRDRIVNDPAKKKFGEILRSILRLRQACLWQGDSHLIKKAHFPNLNKIHSTKISFLLDQLEQIQEEGHQAIIFSQFTTYLDIIQAHFKERHWKTSRIDGTLSAKTRQKQIELFQNGEHKLFLISLRAGGVGLNLTAASYVFIMDPWWNPAVENQAIDRAYRIGQKNKLTVYRPVIKNSVEEKVLELQKTKKELFNELLPDGESDLFTGKLTFDDFRHLLF